MNSAPIGTTSILTFTSSGSSSVMHATDLEPGEYSAAVMRLSSEILARCFCWLPFRDRMTVSHVTWLWRSIALAHPAVWADSDLSPSRWDKPELLRMALSRTGTHPVSISGLSGPDPGCIVVQYLKEHLHHIRRVQCTLPDGGLPLNIAAPLLEELVCDSHPASLDIPVDCLGGQPARLKILNLPSIPFPAACPVLSTVTSLVLDGPLDGVHAVTYSRLFALCPRLISLSRYGLYPQFARLLPPGPAPQSLQNISLSTSHEKYDLTAHLSAWHPPNLREVGSARPAQFARLVDGTERLRIFFKDDEQEDLHIAADTGRRTFSAALMYWDDTRQRDIAQTMINAVDALRAVKHLSVPLDMLVAFLPLIAALPALVSLEVCIVFAPASGAAHHLPRDMLPGLMHIADARPALDKLVLYVLCPRGACRPTATDAQQLVDCLMSIQECRPLPRQTYLKGFPRDTCARVVGESDDGPEPR